MLSTISEQSLATCGKPALHCWTNYEASCTNGQTVGFCSTVTGDSFTAAIQQFFFADVCVHGMLSNGTSAKHACAKRKRRGGRGYVGLKQNNVDSKENSDCGCSRKKDRSTQGDPSTAAAPRHPIGSVNSHRQRLH